MKDRCFDNLAVACATTVSRRRLLRLFVGASIGGGLAGVGARSAIALPTGERPAALATFKVRSQYFRVLAVTPATIAQLRALESGESRANIPAGRLRRGPGPLRHNAPWSWHIEPATLEMGEMAVEACDGTPRYLQRHLDEWLASYPFYCPWSAELVTLTEFHLPG